MTITNVATLNNINRKLSMISLNIQSANDKFYQFKMFIGMINKQFALDIVCLHEWWITENTDMLIMFNLPGYTLISKGNVCCGQIPIRFLTAYSTQ